MPAPAAAGLHNCAVGAPGRVALLREAAGSAEAGGLGPSAGSGGSGGAGLHIVEVRGSPLGAAWDPHGDVLAACWKGRVALYGWGATGEDGAMLAESSLRFIPQALALAAMPLPGGGRSYLLALGGVLGVAFRVLERGAPGRSWTLLAAEAREPPPPPPPKTAQRAPSWYAAWLLGRAPRQWPPLRWRGEYTSGISGWGASTPWGWSGAFSSRGACPQKASK